MDDHFTQPHYRPIYRELRVGTRSYSIIDLDLAKERAYAFLEDAWRLLELNKISLTQQRQIYRCLLTATDLGSEEAPYLFALQLLNPELDPPFAREEAIHFLKIAAERGHGDAAYRLATAYGGMGRFPEVEGSGLMYFHRLSPRERQQGAEQYFEITLAQNHQEGIEDMIIAYAYGRGYIPKNVERFVNVCEQLVKRKNQAVVLGYGAWLAGMTVEGQKPLAEAVQLPPDLPRALDFLLMASLEGVLELCQHALHLICLAMMEGRWNLKFFKKRLLREAEEGHQLLAFYFAWYSIPENLRPSSSSFLQHYLLLPLADLIEPDEEQAIFYLKHALFGENELLRIESKALLRDLFGEREERVLHEKEI